MGVTRTGRIASIVSVLGSLDGMSACGQIIGPSTTHAPYVLPSPTSPAGTLTKSILTVGESVRAIASKPRLVLPDGRVRVTLAN